MKESDVFRGGRSKHTLTLLHIFRGSGPPNLPRILRPSLRQNKHFRTSAGRALPPRDDEQNAEDDDAQCNETDQTNDQDHDCIATTYNQIYQHRATRCICMRWSYALILAKRTLAKAVLIAKGFSTYSVGRSGEFHQEITQIPAD